MRKYYISFADDNGFLGACIVQATSPHMATIVAMVAGCNPGGEALIHEVDEAGYQLTPYPLNTLLQKSDLLDPVHWDASKTPNAHIEPEPS